MEQVALHPAWPSNASVTSTADMSSHSHTVGTIPPAYLAADPRADDGAVAEPIEDEDDGSDIEAPTTDARAGGKVAPFVYKLWAVMNDPSVSSVVSWEGEDGLFVVRNAEEFLRSVLPRVVRSVSFCAFVRQLNSYGFSKTDPARAAFRHLDGMFKPGRADLLSHVMRRGTMKRRHNEQESDDVTRTASSRPRSRPQSRGRAVRSNVSAPAARLLDDSGDGEDAFYDGEAPLTTGATMQDVMIATAALAAGQKKVVRAAHRGRRAPAPAQGPIVAPTVPVQPQSAPAAAPLSSQPGPVLAQLMMSTVPSATDAAPSPGVGEDGYLRRAFSQALHALREVAASAADPAGWTDGSAAALIDMVITSFLREQEKALQVSLLPATNDRAAAMNKALHTLASITDGAPSGRTGVSTNGVASVPPASRRTTASLSHGGGDTESSDLQSEPGNVGYSTETSSISGYGYSGEHDSPPAATSATASSLLRQDAAARVMNATTFPLSQPATVEFVRGPAPGYSAARDAFDSIPREPAHSNPSDALAAALLMSESSQGAGNLPASSGFMPLSSSDIDGILRSLGMMADVGAAPSTMDSFGPPSVPTWPPHAGDARAL